jgi:hypothetical protein
MINPSSFKQISREIQLPGIYDPPSMRKKQTTKKKVAPKKNDSNMDTGDKDKTSVDKTSVDKTSVDKTSVDKTSVDKTSVDKTSVDKTSVGKTSVLPTDVDTSVDKTDVESDNVYYVIKYNNNKYYYETITNNIYDDYRNVVGKLTEYGVQTGDSEHKFKSVDVYMRDDDYITIDGLTSYNKILDDNLNIGLECM